MKQKVITPQLKHCICGCLPEVVSATQTGFNHYERHYSVKCNCSREWPRNSKSIHRAICKWNNRIDLLLSRG
jgi:hypothetical protein